VAKFDLQLIEKAKQGDPLALDQLLNVCQIDVRNYARLHCRASDIEDATQETLFTVSKHLSKLNSLQAFSSWLFVILKRECQRALRVAYRFISAEPAEKTANQNDQDVRMDLISALESLPPHYLQIILLRDFEERSIEEISAELGEPIPAVKSRLHRARKLMREYLTKVN
jgi:RNA polymerase sigma factor (sigma-70 family)